MNLEKDAAGYQAERLIVEKLEKATRRAKELNINDLRDKMAFISGWMSTDYPELSHVLLRIYQPID